MQFDWSKYKGNLGWLEQNTILLTLTGSHAYGLATDSSDYDWRGVCIPPKEYFTGFMRRFEQADSGFEGVDCSIFDIRKFFQLAADANPNIIEILWAEINDVAVYTQFGLSMGWTPSVFPREVSWRESSYSEQMDIVHKETGYVDEEAMEQLFGLEGVRTHPDPDADRDVYYIFGSGERGYSTPKQVAASIREYVKTGKLPKVLR